MNTSQPLIINQKQTRHSLRLRPLRLSHPESALMITDDQPRRHSVNSLLPFYAAAAEGAPTPAEFTTSCVAVSMHDYPFFRVGRDTNIIPSDTMSSDNAKVLIKNSLYDLSRPCADLQPSLGFL